MKQLTLGKIIGIAVESQINVAGMKASNHDIRISYMDAFRVIRNSLEYEGEAATWKDTKVLLRLMGHERLIHSSGKTSSAKLIKIKTAKRSKYFLRSYDQHSKDIRDLIDVIKDQAVCGYCGAVFPHDGWFTEYDGWQRCPVCYGC